jgi:hypothetical protein
MVSIEGTCTGENLLRCGLGSLVEYRLDKCGDLFRKE